MAEQQIVDPSLQGIGPSDLKGLSPEERSALGATVDPQQTLSNYRQQNAQESTHIENIEMQRIQTENQRMREQLEQNGNALTELRSNYDNLSGQMTAQQQSQLLAQQTEQANQQFQFSQDELENHGDVLPLMEKVAAKTRFELEREFEQRLAREKQVWQQEATAPLQQQLENNQQRIEAQDQQYAARFNNDLEREIETLGLGSMDSLIAMPEFATRYNQAVAPGVNAAWGDMLKQNIENRDFHATSQMLRDFRENNTNLKQREDLEVPAGSAPQKAPLTNEAAANLTKRETLMKILMKRQEDANNGKFYGGSRSKYQVEQQKLRTQIDAIPTN